MKGAFQIFHSVLKKIVRFGRLLIRYIRIIKHLDQGGNNGSGKHERPEYEEGSGNLVETDEQ